MERVAELMSTWARVRGEPRVEKTRWLAAGFLHDALRDEDHETLRAQVEPVYRSLPGNVLHGPAAARMLLEEGIEDEELVHAIRFHTLGSAEFGNLGLALYAADFLEPGRSMRKSWRAKRRRRAATDLKAVVKEILAARIGYLLEKGRPLHPQTADFWNKIAEGQPWVSASEF
jgi:2-amino-4-hydroxy-6-hydroxymethyldihydropteridine diphosphokinase